MDIEPKNLEKNGRKTNDGRTLTLIFSGYSICCWYACSIGFKHYYQRFAEEEDMNDGTVTQVEIVSDKTKKTRGRK